MISQAAEYSMRALLCLAGRGAAMTTQQLAAAGNIPVGYLAKVLQALVRAKLVSSQRGLNGGFVLHADPRGVTLYDVMRVMERSKRIDECPLGGTPHPQGLCALHRRLDEAAEAAEAVLRRTTLADLLAETGRGPLCPPQAGNEPDIAYPAHVGAHPGGGRTPLSVLSSNGGTGERHG